MRNTSNEFEDIDLTNNQVHYNYEITLKNNQLILLTSEASNIVLEDKIFSPNCGINFIQGYFNDSAKDYILLTGIYAENAINKNTELEGAKVKIWRQAGRQKYYHLVTFYCTIYTKYDLSFQLQLEPETNKYNQSLLKCYSKTCRTNFGDDKCKLNKNNYSFNHDILEINGRIFTLSTIVQESGYFSGGEVIIDNIFYAKIITHFRSIIETDKAIPEIIKNYRSITLIAGCDKKFITCCNKFDNAVNFRGEPFIPKHNFLQIS